MSDDKFDEEDPYGALSDERGDTSYEVVAAFAINEFLRWIALGYPADVAFERTVQHVGYPTDSMQGERQLLLQVPKQVAFVVYPP